MSKLEWNRLYVKPDAMPWFRIERLGATWSGYGIIGKGETDSIFNPKHYVRVLAVWFGRIHYVFYLNVNWDADDEFWLRE